MMNIVFTLIGSKLFQHSIPNGHASAGVDKDGYDSEGHRPGASSDHGPSP